jgi:hypothetical protein
VPNANRQILENYRPENLIALFASCKVRPSRIPNNQLAEAWGILFSRFYLSEGDLVDSMKAGEHKLGKEGGRMLREFISSDCAKGGHFVIEVITKGGSVDRAALFMIADLKDIAAIQHNGTTALHLLTDACDKYVRPALIEQAGKHLLSDVYNTHGMPVLFTIFSLPDLRGEDLDAIAKMFSQKDLEKVMNRNRSGKNAFEIFTETSLRFKTHVPGERNKFFVSHAVRTTTMEIDRSTQKGSFSSTGNVSGTQAGASEGKKETGHCDRTQTAADKFEAMTKNPLDDIGNIRKKQQ